MELVEGDVGEVVARADGWADVILMDVDNGPHWASFRSNVAVLLARGARRVPACARPHRVRSPFGAEGYPADAFADRLREAGFVSSIVPLVDRGRTRARAYVGRLG